MPVKTHLRQHQIPSTPAPPTPISSRLQPAKPAALKIHPPLTSVTSPTAATPSKVHILEKLEEFEGCSSVLVEETGSPEIDLISIILSETKDNEELGMVQVRWSFVNKDENLLNCLQNINMCFHFEVEQQVNGVYLNFFGLGCGGRRRWRIQRVGWRGLLSKRTLLFALILMAGS